MTTIPTEVPALAVALAEDRAATGEVTERRSFRPDVRLEPQGDGVRITYRWGELTLRQPGAPLAAALHRLQAGPVSLDELGEGLLRGDRDPRAADTDLATLHWLLGQLQGITVRSLWSAGRQLIAAVPLVPRARLATARPGPDDLVRLSRFAYLHRHADGLAAESPLSLYRLESTSPEAAAVLTALASVTTTAGLPGEPQIAYAIACLLISAGMAGTRSGAAGRRGFAEDDDEVLRQWAFHDLLFHSRSRLGRHDDDFGATFPFLGELDPQPAVRPLPDGPRVPLPRPELASLLERDATLTAAIEARRSVRHYDERPPTAGELGELLYRSARVRATLGPEPDHGMPYPATDRPYPCGGAAYDLDLYLTVRRCEGLEPGGYFYDPLGHQLVRLSQAAGPREQLLHGAFVACGGATVPDVLITLTARFARLGWKYRGIAYAATLKHVGVLYQTFYLVATAMGLAPCGLGSGDADLAARAFGLDWARESSVGEFMLGRRPASFPDNPVAAAVPSYQPANDAQWVAEAARTIRRPAPIYE
jgi:SagB-type dehydrogenase family enzyme